MLLSVSPEHWDQHAGPIGKMIGQKMLGNKIHNLSNRISTVKTFDELIHALAAEWNGHNSLVLAGNEPNCFIKQYEQWPKIVDLASRTMFIDAMTYMPDDILVKVDRAAMAVSLETRTPFLDHRVAELAWTLPIGMKIKNGNGKHVLRQVLYKYVPQQLIDRPKMGFSIPIDQWLRNELRDWAEDLLAPERLMREGYFDVEMIRAAWQAHLNGTRNSGSRLWSVLMFQSWLQEQS
jgi:asparagine synthase (glutamine-hydrolysing)